MRLWLGLLPLAVAFGQAPSFRAGRVLPSGSAKPAPLAPGMLVSIYGEHLGPNTACEANADSRRTETPNPARPVQSFAERLIYPTELCGVQVTLAGLPAGLLYVSGPQINFKAPQGAPISGEAELKVSYGGSAGTAKLRVGLETTSLTVEGEPRAGAPLWIHIDPPYGWGAVVQYPVRIQPGDFGCNELEVRRNGVMLPRIRLRPPAGGITFAGNPCGNIAIEGHAIPHTGRLPLHLQYRLDEPGVYEVRYTLRQMDYRAGSPQVVLQSEWTPVRVMARATHPPAPGSAPQDAAELLSDYLPGLLGFGDRAGLDAVIACLYHASGTVRQFAAGALAYWPEDEVNARVDHEAAVRGPSDTTIEGTLRRHPGMLPLILPYLKSDNPALLRGAITGASRFNYAHPAESAAGAALIAAAEHIIRAAAPQTLVEFAAALGSVRDQRAGNLLWDLVRRNIARGQALIAISWRKDPRDLSRLGALLEGPSKDLGSVDLGSVDLGNVDLGSLPYALRNSYGDAALPYLERALTKSESDRVRTECARELILAGRSSGFAFVAAAIEQKKLFAREMIQYVQERFPELRGADDARVLAFLRGR